METLKRRLITIPAALVLLPIFVVLAPAALIVGSLWDFYGKRRGQPTARLWAFGTVWLLYEWAAIFVAVILWIASLFAAERVYPAYRFMEGWWAAGLLRWARRILAVNLVVQDLSTMPAGQLIVASRHSSPVDAIIPAWLFARALGRPVHYVIKRELRWMPSIDIYGTKLGNHFVTRGGNTHAEVTAITELALRAERDAALVIFPEGTYSTEPVRQRVRVSLQRRGETSLLELAHELNYLLPPKIAGFEAFCAAAPEATLVVMGHTGLEGVAELSSLRHTLPLTHDVLLRWWVTETKDRPVDPCGREAWLHSEWLKLDAWLESTHKGDRTI